MDTIGKRVKARRLDLKLNQGDLGAQVGLDQSTISDIEKGSGFAANILMRLCHVLHTTPEYLMRGGDIEDIEGAEIASIYRALEPVEKQILLKMARSLVSTENKQSKPNDANRKSA